MSLRYTVDENIEDDYLTVTDTLGIVTNSFDSEMLILSPIEDASPLIERLQFLECYTKALKESLIYGPEEWTEKDFRNLKEEVELNMQ